jgi:hypothetical protein
VAAAIAGAVLACPAAARAEHGPSYSGEYANAFMTGRADDGRRLSVMAGVHADFPYHDPGSGYDQVAVRLDGEEPLVLTARPRLAGLRMELAEDAVRLSYAGRKLRLDLELRAVRHRPRYEGDPAQLGDLFIAMGYEPSGDSPGFVYTPYELTNLVRGRIVVRGRRVRVATLHGQAEAGRIEAPTDRRFRTGYDYAAAPTADAGAGRYSFVGFHTRALHAGADAALDAYFRETGSDEMTMEGGSLSDGNRHGVPVPFGNRGPLPPGGRKLAQWATDLGPGILWRKLVRVRDGGGRAVEVLSETIEEDPGAGRDATAPSIASARARARTLVVRLSEPALVSARGRGRWRTLGQGRAGANSFARPRGRGPLMLRAVDESGNRSRRAVAR